MARRSPRIAVVLVVLVALTNGTLPLPLTPSASAAETEVFATNARSMTVENDFRRVLYTSFDGCPGGEFPVSCMLRSLPEASDGASASVVFRSGSRAHDLAGNVVHDRRHIYWVGAGGDILRIPRHTADPTPTVFAARENASSSSELAIDGTHLYWTENVGDESGKLFRASKAGGARELMHSNRHSAFHGLRSDGRGGVLYLTSYPAIFLCCFSILERATSDGLGGFITEHADFQAVDSFALDDERAYWITRLGTGLRPQLRSAPIGDLSDDRLHHTFASAGSPRWPVLAVDEVDLYWQEVRGSGGPLWTASKFGGEPRALALELLRADQLLSTGLHVFLRIGTTIHRLPVGAAAEAFDLVGDEMAPEVVQVIQNPAHDVPLIEGKKTLVRVYGRIGERSEGFTPGSFAAASYAAGANPESVAVADFDADGTPDLAVANAGSNGVSVLLGDGEGGFTAARRFPVGDLPRSVAVADFDGDGDQDLVSANVRSNSVSILLGDGAGGFGPASSFPVGDLPQSVGVGDLDGDNHEDLAVANAGSDDVSVLLGDGAGGFGPARTLAVVDAPQSVTVGDVDGDGDLDLAAAGSGGISILLGDGAGGFAAATELSVGSSPESIAVGDLDADGSPDLAVANASGDEVVVLLGDGAGGFGHRRRFAAGDGPQSVAVGDLNADGTPDLAVANAGSDDVSILLGDGEGSFGTAKGFLAGDGPRSVAVADFNGDTFQDLAVANFSSGDVSILSGKTRRIVAPAVLHGTRGGARLPGSPLRPVEARPFTSAEIDRTNKQTTLLFELPSSWTQGTITLRSELNPSSTAVETDFSNNGAQRTVTFERTGGVCVDFVLVSTHAGVSSPGVTGSTSVRLGRVMRHIDRATSILPLDRLAFSFNGGPPRTRPLIGDPYNMRDWSQKNELMMNLSVEFTASGPPPACGDRRTVRTAMVPDSDRAGLSWISPYIYFTGPWGETPEENRPFGGVAGLAHELGHQLGRAHVNCWRPGGARPAFTDPSYPYQPCRISDSNDYVGLDSISRKLIVPIRADGRSGASDFMSYGPRPQWASDYTYRGTANELGLAPAAASAPVSAAGSEPVEGPVGSPAATASLIAGFIPEEGGAVLSDAYEVSAAARDRAAEEIAAGGEPNQDIELRTYDAEGGLLANEPVVAGLVDDGAGDSVAFLNLIDTTSAARLELVTSSGEVLAENSPGLARPELAIASPMAGDVAGEELEIRWSAKDPDEDALRHLVRYSPDDGETWIPLATGVTEQRLTVDAATLPGGKRAWIEVVSTDGLHSTTAAAGPFTVPAHPPEPVIFGPDRTPLGEDDSTTISSAEGFRLDGVAYDAEEGMLAEEAMRWEVDGPVDVKTEGAELRLDDLPPGTYEVKLLATDGEGAVGSTTTELIVGAKRVENAIPPRLDGRCDDEGYDRDPSPILLRHESGDALARLVRGDGALFACVSGLPSEPEGDELLLALDLDHSADKTAQPDDLFFRVAADGSIRTGRGDGLGGVAPADPPEHLTAAVARGGKTWSAEVRIDPESLSPWERLAGMRLAHRWGAPAQTEDVSWPRGSEPAGPHTWGTIEASQEGAPEPPSITVPPEIVVTADGPDGAVVTYEVEVNDPVDPSPIVRCDPTSGVLFPIGSTTVTCTARNAKGLEAEARFGVTVEPMTSKDARVGVRDLLAALLPTGDADADHRVEKALKDLDGSLHPELWIGETRLAPDRGGTVFGHDEQAVRELGKAGGASLGEAMDAVVALDLVLALGAIDDAGAALVAAAPEGDPHWLGKAGERFADARDALGDAREESDHVESARLLADAWKLAQQAISFAERAEQGTG